jgi:hypothetical protein
MALRKKTYIVALIVLALVIWMGVRRYQCKKRGAAFHSRVAALENEAHNRLTIGAKREVVEQFFADQGIPLTFDQSEASGTIPAEGCSPFGCGSDKAVIGMRVEVDEFGTVRSSPSVIGMYADCL